MRRFSAVLLGIALGFSAIASAHSGLRFSSPIDGATLGAAPSVVQLTFVEAPEPSLASIRVLDTSGAEYQTGRPSPVAGDPLSLTIAVRPLDRGVYTVHWRVVSAVDGHASAGGFVFGVQMAPTGPATIAADASVSWLEAAGRSVFLIGLILALGVIASSLCGFASAAGWRLAVTPAIVTACGFAILALSQLQAAQAPLPEFAATAVGRAVMARGAGVLVMLAGIVAIALGSSRRFTRAWGHAMFAIGVMWCVVSHSLAGHAAAGRFPVPLTVAIQSLHILAAGAWLGGLAVLIVELRAGTAHARAIARFSSLAAIMLAIVAISGMVRGYQEVIEWRALATSYGAFAIAKLALLAAIAVLGALNRWRNMRIAESDARPLQRTAIAELNLAVIATIAAAILGSLPPPAGAAGIAGLSGTASDFATTVTATFTAVSNQPGPNRFAVSVEDYDSGEAIDARSVSLRFTPVDDPVIEPATLPLARQSDGAYAAMGAQMAFPGRWRVEMIIERNNTSVTVPVEVEAKGPPQFTSVLRQPGAPPTYTIETSPQHSIRVTVDPEKEGENQLQILFANVIFEPLTAHNVVVTTQSGDAPVQVAPVQQVDRARYTARVVLRRGNNRVAITGRTESGERIRAVTELLVRSGY